MSAEDTFPTRQPLQIKLATTKLDVFAVSRVTKMTRNVAFVRGAAYHESEADPIATATGTFMVGTSSGRAKRAEGPTE